MTAGSRKTDRVRDKRLDWNKYTDFRSRNSREDLAKLCRKFTKSQLVDVFSTPDKVGLYPIHWAAIHNRSDLIEFMIESGSPRRVRCKNKLFADGTPLHLASMNGSIEAAAILLSESRGNQSASGPAKEGSKESEQQVDDWLRDRDAEGQTALMRSAAPRSKRMDTVRDLLRKNLWSLNGRPAEMALFLINRGADWRLTDSINGMNLMHLAIVNDYDDIVNLLLVIDKRLAKVATLKQVRTTPKQISPVATQQKQSREDFVTVDLKDESDQSGTSSPASNEYRPLESSSTDPLISDKQRAKELLANGLLPLQLAIIYGRLSVISQLWFASESDMSTNIDEHPTGYAENKTSNSSPAEQLRSSHSSRKLKMIMLRACWTNSNELRKIIHTVFLKSILAIDLGLMAILWVPFMVSPNNGDRGRRMTASGGIFILSFCISLMLAFRVMLKNPGYLRRSSVQYLNELAQLVRKKQSSSDRTRSNEAIPIESTSAAIEQQQQPVESEKIKKESSELKDENNAQSQVNRSSWKAQSSVAEKVRLLCHRCKCVRRPRSRHCNYCNHCVQDFDHHCIYMGCCIGRENRLDFLVMLIMMSVTAIYGTVLLSREFDRRDLWQFLGIVWVLKYAVIGVLSAFLILRRACLGVTMYEDIRSNRVRRVFGPGGPSESISKSHRVYSTLKGSYWRYSPDRFLTGDLPASTILANLREFLNHTSLEDYLLSIACSDSALVRTITSNDSRVNLYKIA